MKILSYKIKGQILSKNTFQNILKLKKTAKKNKIAQLGGNKSFIHSKSFKNRV